MNAPLHREMPAGLLDAQRALSDVTARWDGDIVRQLRRTGRARRSVGWAWTTAGATAAAAAPATPARRRKERRSMSGSP